MKHIHYISWLLASTAEWLTIRDNSGVLTKIHWSKVTCTHTHLDIETPHTTYGASENGGINNQVSNDISTDYVQLLKRT